MSHHWRLRGLLLLAVCSIAGAVLAITTFERSEEKRVSQQLIAGQQMLSTLVEAHAALHSYAGDAGVNDAVEFGVQERAYLAAARSAFLADNERRGAQAWPARTLSPAPTSSGADRQSRIFGAEGSRYSKRDRTM